MSTTRMNDKIMVGTWVPRDLRDQFALVASLNDRSLAAQLRVLMREQVSKTKTTTTAAA